MPEWIAHIIAAWIPCRLLRYKYPLFNPANTAIAILGSILPDVAKIGMILSYKEIYITPWFAPLHTPFGSIILALIVSLFFQEKKIVFIFLLFGIITHFLLDVMMSSVGGIHLLFPISFQGYELAWIGNNDLIFSIFMILLGMFIYLITIYVDKRAGG